MYNECWDSALYCVIQAESTIAVPEVWKEDQVICGTLLRGVYLEKGTETFLAIILGSGM